MSHGEEFDGPGDAPGTPVTIYPEVYAAGSDNGLVQAWSRNMTITRNAQGQWTAVFSTPHPDGTAYHPSLTNQESFATRDARDIQIIQGSKTANGFRYMLTTGDNGGAADSLQDEPHSVSVAAPVEVLAP